MRCRIFIVGLFGPLMITASSGVQPVNAGGTVRLSGKASWDMELVREYMKKEHQVEVPPQPAPWRNQNMAAHLNGEFVKRLNALMATYQALGGDTNLGIESPTGGLRSAQDQIELFKKCRRIRQDMHMQPVGDGSKESDWEEIPKAERTGEGVVSQEAIIGGGKVTFEKHGPIEDCGVKWTKKMPNGDVIQATFGTVTEAWVSWHNLGLAADLTETLVDNKGKVYQNGLPSNDAWNKLTNIFGELGLTYGGWWPWDPDHVEFHPRMAGPSNFGQSGQPLPDSELRTGYNWKIPSSIFVYKLNMDNSRANELDVFDLKEDGGNISVSGFRGMYGERNGPWSARWMTFDPPVRLFPAYIPTIHLLRNSGVWPQDTKWESDNKVEEYTYHESLDSNGKKYLEWLHATGQAHFSLDMRVRNRQYEANIRYGQSVPLKDSNEAEYHRIRQLWQYLDRTSVYDIDLSVRHQNTYYDSTVQTRHTDTKGYTEDTTYTIAHESSLLFPSLAFAWDRDKGDVGAGQITSFPQKGTYTLTEVSPVATIFVSDRLPGGAWDLPQPVPEPPANPRPKDQKKSQGGGFLRP